MSVGCGESDSRHPFFTTDRRHGFEAVFARREFQAQDSVWSESSLCFTVDSQTAGSVGMDQ
jgi:hypothetical protein